MEAKLVVLDVRGYHEIWTIHSYNTRRNDNSPASKLSLLFCAHSTDQAMDERKGQDRKTNILPLPVTMSKPRTVAADGSSANVWYPLLLPCRLRMVLADALPEALDIRGRGH